MIDRLYHRAQVSKTCNSHAAQLTRRQLRVRALHAQVIAQLSDLCTAKERQPVTVSAFGFDTDPPFAGEQHTFQHEAFFLMGS